jgi:hypothetical protein
VKSTHGTLESEEILDLGEHVYSYVGRCEPAYSACAIAYQADESVVAQFSPFDTGGLAQGHIHCTPGPMNAASMRNLVRRNSWSAADFLPKFLAWGRSAFAQPRDYVEGSVEPTVMVTTEIARGGQNAPRAWTWEARLRKESAHRAPLAPVQLVME